MVKKCLIFVFGLMLFLCICNPKKIDEVLLIEELKPAYWQWLGTHKTHCVEDYDYSNNDSKLYRYVSVKKSGFGGVSPDDLKYYLKTAFYQFPDAEWTTIRFEDGTGLVISDNDQTGKYGDINNLGLVEGESKLIDLRQPLQSQISDLTTIQYEYDNKNSVIYEHQTDMDGKTLSELFRDYDRYGNVIWEKVCGLDGVPIINKKGYAEFRREYDGKQLKKDAYFDGNGVPVIRKDKGYAAIVLEYDKNHNCIHEQYYGIDGKPISTMYGYASKSCEYEKGNPIRESYYGIDGNPCLNLLGYASIERIFNENNKITSERYFSCNDTLTNCINGYAQKEYEYDDQGNIVIERYRGADGQAVVTSLGYAEVHRVYNKRRKVINESYYGADGKPLIQTGGYFSICQEWGGDRENTLISRNYLDVNGKSVLRTDGYTSVLWGNSSDGSRSIQFIDENGKEISKEGLNLLQDFRSGQDGWSEWYAPERNITNSSFSIARINLEDGAQDNTYSCSIEIEFKDVKVTDGESFLFRAQGLSKGEGVRENLWNKNIVCLTDTPQNGIYTYHSSIEISSDTVKTRGFDIGFRCDYWSSGAFRVRKAKIEKGNVVGDWTPGI